MTENLPRIRQLEMMLVNMRTAMLEGDGRVYEQILQRYRVVYADGFFEFKTLDGLQEYLRFYDPLTGTKFKEANKKE